MLSILSDLPLIRKTDKNQVRNSFFWYNCKFYRLKTAEIYNRVHLNGVAKTGIAPNKMI